MSCLREVYMPSYDIDTYRLRNDLLDYFGTAIECNPMAVMELSRVQTASDDELVRIAIQNGFNINNYIKNSRGR